MSSVQCINVIITYWRSKLIDKKIISKIVYYKNHLMTSLHIHETQARLNFNITLCEHLPFPWRLFGFAGFGGPLTSLVNAALLDISSLGPEELPTCVLILSSLEEAFTG